MSSGHNGKIQPPGHKNPQNMAVCEERDMSYRGLDHIHETIDTDPDLFGSFPCRTSIGKNHPVRHLLMDLRGR